VSGPSPELERLADLHGVATTWLDQLDRPVQVSGPTIVKVLAAMGVDATSDEAIAEALRRAGSGSSEDRRPAVILVHPQERPEVDVAGAGAVVRREDGSREELPVVAGRVRLPGDLPLGWHALLLDDGSEVPIIVAPERLPTVGEGWGLTVQLYAVPSTSSWGIGDLADLKTLVSWTADHGGDVVLVNPLHAVSPTAPMQPSPYFPASRRWLNPVYLRVEDLPEYHAAEAGVRRHVDALRPVGLTDRIDRDAAWSAKQAALELLFDPADVEEPTGDLADFAVWAALSERHGADWREWPPELRRPESPAVARARSELAVRVRWHAWLQRRTDEQCRAAQAVAAERGMRIGVMHDLAVGTDPGGADAWVLQEALALDARIGAPPDEFNQRGQDWGMPPWRPDELARLGYAPLRDMVRAQAQRGGGLRIDHILGLFRLWWIPVDGSSSDGAYVRYDAAAMLAVIALEAVRAGAVVVGEDLGTVPKEVRTILAESGVLGTSLLLFEREDAADGAAGRLRPLASWRKESMASVSTHDLPTALGWLRGEHVKVRGELGQLRDVGEEWAAWQRERDELVASLRSAALIEADADDVRIARAMQQALTLTPSRWIVAAPGDAVGDLRQPNLPGTTDEYPNWRLALTTHDGRPIPLDELLADERMARLAGDLGVRPRSAAG